MPADTPALDALLREVDNVDRRRRAATWQGDIEELSGASANAAPRLAAIVRVLVEALSAIEGSRGEVPEYYTAVTALARAEALAKGE